MPVDPSKYIADALAEAEANPVLNAPDRPKGGEADDKAAAATAAADDKAADAAPDEIAEKSPGGEPEVSGDSANEASAAEKPAPKPDRKGFDELVRAQSTLRKREQELIAREQKHEAFLRAAESGDPIAAFQAMGLSWNDVVRKVVAGSNAPAQTTAKQPEAESALLAEVKALRAEREQEKRQAFIEQTKAQAKQAVTANAGDFPLLSEEDDPAGLVIAELESYHAQTGRLPVQASEQGYTKAEWQESLKLAAEVVEERLVEEAKKRIDQAKKYEARLTKLKKPGSTPDSSTKPDSSATSGQATQSKTLNQGMSAPAKPAAKTDKPIVKNDEYYQRLALED